MRLGHHSLEHPVRARKPLDLALDCSDIAFGDGLARLCDDRSRLLDRIAPEVARGDDLLHLREKTLDLANHPLGLLLGRFKLFGRPTLDHVVLCVLEHVFDFVARQSARGRNLDRLLLSGFEVLRVNADDAIRVDLERNLDLDASLGRSA